MTIRFAIIAVAALAAGACNLTQPAPEPQPTSENKAQDTDRDGDRGDNGQRDGADSRVSEERERESGPTGTVENSEVTEAWFVGRWASSRECNDAISFERNGVFTVANGQGRWSVENGVLIIIAPDRRQESRIRKVTANEAELLDEDERIYRCD